MAKGNPAKITNKDGLRAVPGYQDIIAVKAQCDHEIRCTDCKQPIRKGQPMWFCDGQYLKDGLDGRWHDKCL